MAIKNTCIYISKRVLFCLLLWYSSLSLILQFQTFYEDYTDEELLTLSSEDYFDHNSSIFFIEGFGKDYISPRMICSIESAARGHRNTFIDVMMTSQSLKASDGIKSLLKAYSNVRFLYLNATAIYMESPMREWFLSKIWKTSRYPEINFSDPLRTLLLFKYGGIYLDMDVIVLKKLPNLENFAGLEASDLINCAVIGFKKGHPFLKDCITEMTKHFNSEVWGTNTPQLYTKIFRRRCHFKSRSTTLKNCSDVKLFEREAFYPLHWSTLDIFFKEDEYLTDALLNHPYLYTLHFWNRLTSNRSISLEGQSLFSVIARNLCPITAFVFDYRF